LTASYAGAVASVVFGGIMTLLIVGFTGCKARKLRDLQL